MLKRIVIFAVFGIVLALAISLMVYGLTPQKQVLLSDGRLLHIEAVTFGTNHVVGHNNWWLVPLRRILPNSAVEFLTPARDQSRQTTATDAIVVWVYATEPTTGKYIDCQRIRASFVDQRGDVYTPNGLAHGSFSKGFNRQAYSFDVFPRRWPQLKLQLAPERGGQASTVLIPNPSIRVTSPAWTPETLPATHRVQSLDFRLESLVVQTNGGGEYSWQALNLHWQPIFSLNEGGAPATNWEMPEWDAEDATGNRGQTVGLHEPVLKFMGTTYPRPEAVSDPAKLWLLPLAGLPTTSQGIQWNTNRLLYDLSVTVIGLFPPGYYTFSEGRLTNSPGGKVTGNGWTGMSRQIFPGKWQHWATHGATDYTAFLRWSGGKADARIAVGLRYKLDQVSQTVWGHSKGSAELMAFVFDSPLEGAQALDLEVVLLEPVHSEFVVCPPNMMRAR